MPGRNPVLIAKEYARTAEKAQVRKNAVTALAALDDPEGWKTLMEIAVEDRDAEVRAYAETKIATLPPDSSSVALQPILDRLSSSEQQHKAYAIIGRLQNSGLRVKLPPLPGLKRLALAKSLSDQLYPSKGFRFRFRFWKGALAGAAFGCAACVCLASSHLGADLDSETYLYCALALILVFLLAPIATIFTSPASLQADTRAAVALDVTMGVVAGWCVCLPFALANLQKPVDAVSLMLAAAITVSAVRLGTLATLGIVPSRRLNWAVESLVGGGCGLGAYELWLLLTNGSKVPLLAWSWEFLVPAVCGLAGSYGFIDSQSAIRPRRWNLSALAALLLAAFSLFIVGVAAINLPAPKPIPIEITPSVPSTVSISQVPQTITFTASMDLQCTWRMNPGLSADFSKDGKDFYAGPFSKYPTGSYEVNIDRAATGLESTLFEFAGHINKEDLEVRLFHKQSTRELTKFTLTCAAQKKPEVPTQTKPEVPKPSSPRRLR